MKTIYFYHICTDGSKNGIVHFDCSDYIRATEIAAVLACKYNVRILCFCHMTTHSHFVIYSESYQDAESFANEYKRNYARYAALSRGEHKIFQDVSCTPKLIGNPYYLKTCITYTLMNPVVAGIVRRAEDYKWSSHSVYFNNAPDDSVPISTLGSKRIRTLLHTRVDLTDCKLRIGKDGHLSLKSVIDFEFVENLFGSRTDYFRFLAITDCTAEENRYVSHSFQYSDTEIMAETMALSQKLFEKSLPQQLTKDEKHKLAILVRKKTRASAKQLARILRIEKTEIDLFIGPR